MKLTEERFLKEVEQHGMTALRDDGLYRHLRFRRPDTSSMSFDILTWPGHLAYTGDMGSYVFTRISDMFTFFRGHSPNPGYWSEKCIAADRDGIEEFDQDAFRESIMRRLAEAEDLPDGTREEVERRVLGCIDDGEHEAMRAAIYFEHDGFRFRDFWEARCRTYTHRFMWCCYALPWAIKQYDAKVPA